MNQIAEMTSTGWQAASTFLSHINTLVNDFVWGPVMIFLMIGTGIYFTLFTGFFQLRRFPTVAKQTVGSLFKKEDKKPQKGGITPFEAVCTALAGTIGTGNIVGVTTAIVSGGPGAVFWMWASAIFGMMTKYAEAVLAVQFRTRNKHGERVGGPMYYIQNGLHIKWLAIAFSVLCVLASFGIGNMTQSNAISQAMFAAFAVPTWLSGLVVAAIVGLVILGGISRISKFTAKLVPFMACFYTLGAIIVICCNFKQVPYAFSLIFENAFSFNAVGGGVLGYTARSAMRYGFARGVFTNEAGLGSAPIAHAAAETDSPVRQGMWGIFEVFLDTIVMCTLTGVVVLTAQGATLWTSGVDGAQLTSAAFAEVFGQAGSWFIAIAMLFFAVSTLLGWSYYGERALGYLSDESKRVRRIYRVCFILAVGVGAVARIDLVWSLSDTFNGLMAIPNLIALLALSPVVFRLTREYNKGIKHKRR